MILVGRLKIIQNKTRI